MGCGASTPASFVADFPACTVDAVDRSHVGKRLHVIGTLAVQDGHLLQSPFGGSECIAFTISLFRYRGTSSEPMAPRLRYATRLVPAFKLDGNTSSLIVRPGPDKALHVAWKVHTSQAALVAHNIHQREGEIISGGSGFGQYGKQAVQPNATDFFRETDFMSVVQDNTNSGAEAMNAFVDHAPKRPLLAQQHVMTAGARVAVFATLREGGDGTLYLEADLSSGQLPPVLTDYKQAVDQTT